MFQRLHPFTVLGYILLVASVVPLILSLPSVAAAMLFVAYCFGLLEFQKYTSNYQFALLLIAGTALGIVLDLHYQAWPLLTFSLLFAASATIVRQRFMRYFTYVDLLWVDTGKAIFAVLFYVLAIWGKPFSWDFWLLPIIPLTAAVGLTISYIQDAGKMKQLTRGGYRVQVGRPAPDFELPDQDGNLVRLSDLHGKHPVLLIFVRGDWCPGCHMMLRTYERNRARFKEKGVHVIGIGPDDISVNLSMVQRIGVGYRMLSDDKQEVSSQYGVVYSNPLIETMVDYSKGMPLPASFLVDANGIVRYASRPDRVGEFLDPELIFGVLDGIQPDTSVAWA
ncbi:MAG: redoxin domain-containing protein [Flavobacteriales bacterium]|nr:redoxin domain-containing protein [Flavobacteriales bacterium]